MSKLTPGEAAKRRARALSGGKYRNGPTARKLYRRLHRDRRIRLLVDFDDCCIVKDRKAMTILFTDRIHKPWQLMEIHHAGHAVGTLDLQDVYGSVHKGVAIIGVDPIGQILRSKKLDTSWHWGKTILQVHAESEYVDMPGDILESDGSKFDLFVEGGQGDTK